MSDVKITNENMARMETEITTDEDIIIDSDLGLVCLKSNLKGRNLIINKGSSLEVIGNVNMTGILAITPLRLEGKINLSEGLSADSNVRINGSLKSKTALIGGRLEVQGSIELSELLDCDGVCASSIKAGSITSRKSITTITGNIECEGDINCNGRIIIGDSLTCKGKIKANVVEPKRLG